MANGARYGFLDNNMAEHARCVLCGSTDSTLLFATHDLVLALAGDYCYVRCRCCGLTFLETTPAWDARAAHYDVDYRGYQHLTAASSPLQHLSLAYGLRKRLRIVTHFQPGGLLLDIGCGGGDFVRWANYQRGWQAVGLERTGAMALAAHQPDALPVILGDCADAGLATASVDVITLWTVLEHMANPLQGLVECARVLRPGGLVVIRTVDEGSWGAHWFGPNWLGYDAPRIVTVFSRATLRRAVEQSGFTVLQLGCHFHDFHPLLWSLRNACDEQFGMPALCAAICAGVGSWPVRLLTYPFFALQSRLGKDSFVTMVARKQSP